MTRRIHWYQDKPTLQRKLKGFNAQGRKYGKPLISLEKLTVWLRKNWKSNCEWCLRVLDKRNVSFDHRQALAAGGAHLLDNLAQSCKVCNKRKLASDPAWWKKFIDFLRANDKLVWFNVSYKVNWRRRR